MAGWFQDVMGEQRLLREEVAGASFPETFDLLVPVVRYTVLCTELRSRAPRFPTLALCPGNHPADSRVPRPMACLFRFHSSWWET